MSDINAAIGIGQLKIISYLLRRREIAKFYAKKLSRIGNIDIPFRLDANNSFHLFPVLIEEECRDDFIEKMKAKGIEMAVHFIPLHFHRYYQNSFGYRKGDFPNSEEKYKREVSLPIYPSLNYSEMEYIAKSIKEYFRD